VTNTFVWSDLSTFDIQATRAFYNQCFGWDYQEIDNDYVLCEADKQAVGGLYTMPEKFQSIGMPSFWMSYIKVPNIQQVVRAAQEHGGKVEIQPQNAPGGGLITLIRDPAGAGFTCYEGDDPGGRDTTGGIGRMVWNELHVSDIAKIESFYTCVFGWVVKPGGGTDRYLIYASPHDTEAFAGIQISSNSVKGDKEYWGVYFSVNCLSTASKYVEQFGGKIVAEQPLGSERAVLAYDPQGAAFYMIERNHDLETSQKNLDTRKTKWRAIFGLFIVTVATLSEFNWVWGLLFLFWVIPDIRHGSTHFLEHVERRKNPVVYWLIISVWVILSLYLLFENVHL